MLTETFYLLRDDSVAIDKLMTSYRSGLFEVLFLQGDELPDVVGLMKKYRSIKADFADAALLHLAQREGIDTVFTLDQKDFAVYRLPKKKPLRVVP